MRARALLLATTALLLAGASWVDPHAKAREASRLYAAGDFAGATTKYNEALVDDPDSTLLHYNLGASAYRQGEYDEAIRAYAQSPGADVADVAYNVGNAKAHLGMAAEGEDPEKALTLYAEALAAYRRAMGADPLDEDAKFNHEVVTKKLADLQKKLEEEKRQQEQQEQRDEAQQGQHQQDQEQQEEPQPAEQPEQKPGGEPQQEQEQREPGQESAEEQAGEPQQGGTEPQAAAGEQQAAPAPDQATASRERAEQMTEREAQALLDAARDQEATPAEILERTQPARVLEPTEDW